MLQRIKRAAALLLAGLFLAGMPLQVLAASKEIKSVSIKVSSKLKAGNRLPDIEIGSGTAEDGGIVVAKDSTHFTVIAAEWIDKASKEVSTADEPRMKVTLEPKDVSEYYFLASYKESNIKISGGSYVSARRDGDNLVVTLRVNPIKGDFDMPKDAYWNDSNLGEARWKESENDSGYYEVQLYRDDKSVYKVASTKSKSYNFYPYMTEAGSYTFKIRTIPGTDIQKKYGKKSDWLESGELEITDRYVSDGKGQQKKDSTAKKGTSETVGWFQEGGVWGYRYPDGSQCSGGWASFDDLWYYFNDSGAMLTGWQQIDGEYYYLQPDGQMAVGWLQLGDTWYYLRPEAEGAYPAGSMVPAGWRVIGPYFYYFNQDGSLFTGWLEQGGKRYYLNTVDNSLKGALFTGWFKRDEKTYFADSNGEVMEGWCQIDGQWYYFYPGTGEMAQDTHVDGLYVNAEGVWK